MSNPHNPQQDLDDFFNDTREKRPPAARWGKRNEGDRCIPGTWEGGEILSISKEQKVKFENGVPVEKMVWEDSGLPRMQGVVIYQSKDIGQYGPDDDGRRTFYIEGAMKKAVTAAIAEDGAPGLRVGGKLAIQNTGMAKNSGGYMAYTWVAKYKAPVVQIDDFFDGPPEVVNHQGQPQPSEPPDWAKEPDPKTQSPAVAATRPSTLQQIRQGTASHQAQLKQGFDDEPPF